ncbi:hypothetical protein J1614_005922 [Plenodomus biglobosus]|nr:hypothetical protein J1614_005922 [Plenodomus biglobosus]
MYFLCDALADPKFFQSILHLPKPPTLRKAKIICYQRCGYGTESTVLLGDMKFGSWAGRRCIKGVYL